MSIRASCAARTVAADIQPIADVVQLTGVPVEAMVFIGSSPVRQYAEEKVDEPTEIRIHPGADGSFLLYDDDGRSFNHRKGEWMGIQMAWNDQAKALSLRLEPGSRMLRRRNFEVKFGDKTRSVEFAGRPVSVSV